MGYGITFDADQNRFIGYEVPSTCDHPRCAKEINRGLSYVCGGSIHGGEKGCGQFFCGNHLGAGPDQLCEKCAEGKGETFPMKPDLEEWTHLLATDDSWSKWRDDVAFRYVPLMCREDPSKNVLLEKLLGKKVTAYDLGGEILEIEIVHVAIDSTLELPPRLVGVMKEKNTPDNYPPVVCELYFNKEYNYGMLKYTGSSSLTCTYQLIEQYLKVSKL